MTDLVGLWSALSADAPWLFLGGLLILFAGQGLRWAQDRALATRIRARPPWSPAFTTTPRVSVLVAAWNERPTIRDHVESIRRLRYPSKELILCAGGEDGTLGVAQADASSGVVVLEQRAGEGKQRALQRCLEHATGEVIYLTDADCLIPDEAFERVVEPIVNGQETVTTGLQDPLESQLGIPLVRHQGLVGYYWHYHEKRYPLGLQGRNAAIRRDVLKAVGEFRDPAAIGTDNLLGKKALARGHRIRYIPESRVRTRYAASLRTYWRQQTRWHRIRVVHGLGGWNLKDGLYALARQLLTLLLLVGFLIAVWLGPLVIAVWGLAWISVLITRLRYLAFGSIVSRSRLQADDLLRFPAYVVLDQLVNASTLFQYPSRDLRGRW